MAGSSSATGRASAWMVPRSISPTAGPAASSPTTTTSPPAPYSAARCSPTSSRRACAATRTAPRSTPRASSGAPRSMAAGWSASRRTARSTGWSACRSTASPASISAEPNSTSSSSRRWRGRSAASGGRSARPGGCSRCMGWLCAAWPNHASRADQGEGTMRIEVLVDVKTTLGEGPLWDVEEQRLYWIDSFDGRVFRCTADGREVRSWDVPMKIGSMCLRQRGGPVLSVAAGFHFLDFKSGEVTLIHDPEPDKPNNRINDGKVDQRGRFVAGSMDTMEEGGNGSLYRLDPDLKITRLEGDIIVSNGPCWAPDGKTFYFTDSWSGQISAYDYDLETGSIANKRAFAKMEHVGGAFDGATVDAEGGVWSAMS